MLTIGQKLHDERILRNLSLADVEHATKIKQAFLSLIERGEYKKLPTGAHAQGFVGKYAEFLGFSKKEALALYRREFDEKHAYKVLPKGFTEEKSITVRRTSVTPRTIGIALVGIILLLYVIFQYKGAFLSPSVSISSPQDDSTVNTQTVTVSGKTDPNATVTINTEEVSVDSSGEFKKTVILFPGPAAITVSSKNHFGKETRITRHVLVKPEE